MYRKIELSKKAELANENNNDCSDKCNCDSDENNSNCCDDECEINDIVDENCTNLNNDACSGINCECENNDTNNNCCDNKCECVDDSKNDASAETIEKLKNLGDKN